ncbi:hypothetical protein [Thioalkalivibrio sp. ALE19]|uniref:hypothetical protein n=1 Tax=Thioalkalivibrio sp. ALE19 TaxID=1266909 RepID=UPI0012DC3AB4|nr:hypothetical protein [Thioalkalivibrio sp. ALE19]
MNKRVSQKRFIKTVGRGAVLWVSPAHVLLDYGTKWQSTKDVRDRLQRVVHCRAARGLITTLVVDRLEPYVIPSCKFRCGSAFENKEDYIKIKDFISHLENIKGSKWYKSLVSDLSSNGFARHKTWYMYSEKEVVCFLEGYVRGLVETVGSHGFLESCTGWESTGVIDAAGRIGKTGSGNHRFYIAKVMGVPFFPLKIVGVHERWYDGLKKKHGKITFEKMVNALREVEEMHAP